MNSVDRGLCGKGDVAQERSREGLRVRCRGEHRNPLRRGKATLRSVCIAESHLFEHGIRV